MSDDGTRQFYNRLAEDYHTIFRDWRAGVRWQGEMLAALIREVKPDAQTILDCSCGIGTQAIGLALQGYTVTGTDLSPNALERARREAASFDVEIETGVADFGQLEATVDGTFDVVLSCDNSIAHVQWEDDLRDVFASMASKLNPGGLLLVSLRDYDAVLEHRSDTTTPRVQQTEAGKTLSFQHWEWSEDGARYRLHHFTVKQQADVWETICDITTLRAWQRADVERALDAANLSDVRWRMPDEQHSFHQPVVLATL